jgi:hypothetical protein
MRWITLFMFALLTAGVAAYAEAPPVLHLCDGLNEIALTLQNDGVRDVKDVIAAVDPGVLPEWLRFEECVGIAGARKSERSGERIIVRLFVDGPPKDAEVTLPITLTDEQGCSWTFQTTLRADSARPAETALYTNYPNPFNPSTTIRFSLKDAANVKIVIYNSIGQAVRTLVDGPLSAGMHSLQWSGTNDQGMKAASGVYFYYFTAGGVHQTRKMVLAE